jgi:hypothetical protein
MVFTSCPLWWAPGRAKHLISTSQKSGSFTHVCGFSFSSISFGKRYKFLQSVDNKIRSELGGAVWTIGEWKRAEGELDPCKAGFHCSRRPYDAFDVRGECISNGSKECWREMRIVNAYIWETSDSMLFARFAANLLLEHYRDDPFPELEWESAGVQPEDAAEWVVGCTIWLGEDALAKTNDKFNKWMVEHISKLEEFQMEPSGAC